VSEESTAEIVGRVMAEMTPRQREAAESYAAIQRARTSAKVRALALPCGSGDRREAIIDFTVATFEADVAWEAFQNALFAK
jgi:hypothetical protein